MLSEHNKQLVAKVTSLSTWLCWLPMGLLRFELITSFHPPNYYYSNTVLFLIVFFSAMLNIFSLNNFPNYKLSLHVLHSTSSF